MATSHAWTSREGIAYSLERSDSGGILAKRNGKAFLCSSIAQLDAEHEILDLVEQLQGRGGKSPGAPGD